MNGRIVDSEFATEFTKEDYEVVKSVTKFIKHLKAGLTYSQQKLLAYANDERETYNGSVEFDGIDPETNEGDSQTYELWKVLDAELIYV